MGCHGAPDLRTTQGQERAACDAAAPYESAAHDAEVAKKPRESLQQYLAAIRAQPTGFTTEKDFELRANAIRLVLALDPPPALPDEAQHFFDRGEILGKGAHDETGYRAAGVEYERGLLIAPWDAKGNYNLGLLYALLNLHTSAIRRFRLYLLAAPDAPDRREVQRKIAELEVKIEQSGPGRLVGIWRLYNPAGDASWWVYSGNDDLNGPPSTRVGGHWCPNWHLRIERSGEEVYVTQHVDRDWFGFRAGYEVLLARLQVNGPQIGGILDGGARQFPWRGNEHPGGRVAGRVSDDSNQFEIDTFMSRGMPNLEGYTTWWETNIYRRWTPGMRD
jgi:hypothetical protein